MDKIRHDIEAALDWLAEGDLARVKLHLHFALESRKVEVDQQMREVDTTSVCDNFKFAPNGRCRNCGGRVELHS